MNQTLEAIARAIFKSWFIDFDPVIDNALRAGNPIPDSMAERAEMRRQILDQNQPSSSSQRAKGRNYQGGFDFSGLSEISIDEIYGLFPDSFQDSELGAIPKGWEVGKLDDFAILKTITIQPSAKPEKIWEYYSIPAFDEGKQPIWEVGKNIKSGKYTVPKHSVLASKLNPQFPRVWLPNVKDIDSSICSTEFMPFVPIVERWRTYLYEMLKSQTIQSEIISRITGSTGSRQRVKPKDIAILPSLFPSKKLVDFFCKLVGPLHDNLLSNIQQSAVLTSLRDALLPKLISGELRIQDTEKFLKEAGV
jgi:type I restriction enzyme S subunit